MRGAHCLALPWRRPPLARDGHTTAGGECTFGLPGHVLTKSSFPCSVWTAVTAAVTKRECLRCLHVQFHCFVFLSWIISAALTCRDIFLNHVLPVRNRLLPMISFFRAVWTALRKTSSTANANKELFRL